MLLIFHYIYKHPPRGFRQILVLTCQVFLEFQKMIDQVSRFLIVAFALVHKNPLFPNQASLDCADT